MYLKLINDKRNIALEFWDHFESDFRGGEKLSNDKLQFILLQGFSGLFNMPSNDIFSIPQPYSNNNIFLGNRYGKREIIIPTRVVNQVLGDETITQKINSCCFQENNLLRLEIYLDGYNDKNERIKFECVEVSIINNPIDSSTGTGKSPIEFQLECEDPYIYYMETYTLFINAPTEIKELKYPIAYPIKYNKRQTDNVKQIVNAGQVDMEFIVAFRGESKSSYIQIGTDDDPELYVGVDIPLESPNVASVVDTKKKRAITNITNENIKGKNALSKLIGDFFKIPAGSNIITLKANESGHGVNEASAILYTRAGYLSL